MIHERTVAVEEALTLDRKTLEEAGLHGRLRLLIQPGEIRILPEAPGDLEQVLNNLAGCLGQEPATAYDFGLKIGGLYEAR
jgi:hypothetical protein